MSKLTSQTYSAMSVSPKRSQVLSVNSESQSSQLIEPSQNTASSQSLIDYIGSIESASNLEDTNKHIMEFSKAVHSKLSSNTNIVKRVFREKLQSLQLIISHTLQTDGARGNIICGFTTIFYAFLPNFLFSKFNFILSDNAPDKNFLLKNPEILKIPYMSSFCLFAFCELSSLISMLDKSNIRLAEENLRIFYINLRIQNDSVSPNVRGLHKLDQLKTISLKYNLDGINFNDNLILKLDRLFIASKPNNHFKINMDQDDCESILCALTSAILILNPMVKHNSCYFFSKGFYHAKNCCLLLPMVLNENYGLFTLFAGMVSEVFSIFYPLIPIRQRLGYVLSKSRLRALYFLINHYKTSKNINDHDLDSILLSLEEYSGMKLWQYTHFCYINIQDVNNKSIIASINKDLNIVLKNDILSTKFLDLKHQTSRYHHTMHITSIVSCIIVVAAKSYEVFSLVSENYTAHTISLFTNSSISTNLTGNAYSLLASSGIISCSNIALQELISYASISLGWLSLATFVIKFIIQGICMYKINQQVAYIEDKLEVETSSNKINSINIIAHTASNLIQIGQYQSPNYVYRFYSLCGSKVIDLVNSVYNGYKNYKHDNNLKQENPQNQVFK